MLKISYTELEKQPMWWVNDMVDIITTIKEVRQKEAKIQELKQSRLRGKRRFSG